MFRAILSKLIPVVLTVLSIAYYSSIITECILQFNIMYVLS